MDLSMEIDEDEDINKLKKRKATKANRSKIDDAVVVASSGKRNIKRIILSVTKPSYTLKRGSGRDMRSLRWEHRNKLRYLLRQLIRRQNWDEASGVLSVLLKGTHRENSLSTNRTKYWVYSFAFYKEITDILQLYQLTTSHGPRFKPNAIDLTRRRRLYTL